MNRQFRSIVAFIALTAVISPAIAQAELSAETTQNHVLFQNGGTNLSSAAKEQIKMLGAVFNTPTMQSACVKLVGYSDQSGGTSANLRISLARAESVAAELREHLNQPERIELTEGLGAEGFLPEISPNDPRQRRVAIYARNCPNIEGGGS